MDEHGATNNPTSHPINTKNDKTNTTMKLRLKQQPDALTSRLGTSAPIPKRTLPTPPNSISPTIPPAALKNHRTYTAGSAPGYHGRHAGLDPVESDVDITGTSPADQDFETAGSITSALLAKHHLPDILLSNGPLAIRHIMGYLTTSVPGFSSIQPAKARRLVVGALEGRGGDSTGGGLRGDVKFDKVGWGRWDARLFGQAPRMERSDASLSPSLPAYGMGGITITNATSNVRRPNAPSSPWSAPMDEEEDVEMEDLDHMSLDEPCSSSSEAPDDEDAMSGLDDPELATDDEDWEAMGPKALREASYHGSAPMGSAPRMGHVYTGGSVRSSSYMKPSTQPVLRMRPGVSPLGAGISAITNGLSSVGRTAEKRSHSYLEPSEAPKAKRSHSYLEANEDMEKNAIEALLKLSGSPAV